MPPPSPNSFSLQITFKFFLVSWWKSTEIFLDLADVFVWKNNQPKKKHTNPKTTKNDHRGSPMCNIPTWGVSKFPLEVHHSTVWGVDSVAKWRPFFSSQREKKTWLDTLERELVSLVKLKRLAGNPPSPSRKLHLTFMVDFSFAMLYFRSYDDFCGTDLVKNSVVVRHNVGEFVKIPIVFCFGWCFLEYPN